MQTARFRIKFLLPYLLKNCFSGEDVKIYTVRIVFLYNSPEVARENDTAFIKQDWCNVEICSHL